MNKELFILEVKKLGIDVDDIKVSKLEHFYIIRCDKYMHF